MKAKKEPDEKKVSVGEEEEREKEKATKKKARNKKERIYREDIRGRFAKWAQMALEDQGFMPARHHLRVIEELEGVAAGDWDRLLLLLPPGSAKSTYASLNVLMGTLGAMATSVVSYWVGSSAGRKEGCEAGRTCRAVNSIWLASSSPDTQTSAIHGGGRRCCRACSQAGSGGSPGRS